MQIDKLEKPTSGEKMTSILGKQGSLSRCKCRLMQVGAGWFPRST